MVTNAKKRQRKKFEESVKREIAETGGESTEDTLEKPVSLPRENFILLHSYSYCFKLDYVDMPRVRTLLLESILLLQASEN